MPLFEILELVEGPFEIVVQFPGIVFQAISFSLYKEVESFMDVPEIEDVFNLIVVFVLDLD